MLFVTVEGLLSCCYMLFSIVVVLLCCCYVLFVRVEGL